MKRREVLLVGTAAAVAQSLISTAGCKTKPGTTAAAAASATAGSAELASTLGPCIQAGEACMNHCLGLLAKGDASLGGCAKRVREMLAVCRALETLVVSESRHLQAAAALCASVCDDCRAECEKHAHHHEECKACMEACVKVIAAAKAVAQG